MEMQIFSVYDSKAQAFQKPFFAPTVEFAIRSFRAAVNAPGDDGLTLFPEDFTLYHVGEFDQLSGALLPMDARSLGVAITFKNPEVE